MRAIPEKFLRLLDNVAVVIDDEPTGEQRRHFDLGEGETLYGLYEGIPQTDRGGNYGGVPPDKITIFMRPILEDAATDDQVRAIVRDTVWHEIAHHFGMDDDEVARAEERRMGR